MTGVDPIKVIHKYKNNNRRSQYNTYIFLGDTPSNVMTILEKIKDKNLYNSWLSLDKKDIDVLEKRFGEYWYRFFFITRHIDSMIQMSVDIKANKDSLIKKFGKDWYDKHITSHKLIPKKLLYSYSSMIKEEYERKARNTGRELLDDDVDLDYTLKKKESISKMMEGGGENNCICNCHDNPGAIQGHPHNEGQHLKGGNPPNELKPQYGGDEGEFESADEVEENPYDFNQGMEADDLMEGEEMDLDEIEQMYKTAEADADKNAEKTTKMIKAVFESDRAFKKVTGKLIPFDDSKDDSIHDESLRNVYKKNYITSQYIYKDDTIRMMKNKICCSIQNNKKFGKDSIIIPSRQYLWSEYFYGNNVEKVMIGQKWIHRTELLHIDVEPDTRMRIYESLEGKLKLLRDNIRRYGSKIRREDDDYGIIHDYNNYYTNNEFYMLDIYNDIGLGYNPESDKLRNVIDTYIRIYYPKIGSDNVKNIMDYLNNKPDKEEQIIDSNYDTINNDLILVNEIMKTVEDVKHNNKDHKKLFKENFITQSVIHVNLRIKKGQLDLFRVFNEFIADSQYPFVQFQRQDGRLVYKFTEKELQQYHSRRDSVNMISKWFENAPYGLSFKVKLDSGGTNKFMAVNLNENGRIEYKTVWKEEEMATIKDVKKRYKYIRSLINKINNVNNKIVFHEPEDDEFRFAFINTIQQFELPEKFIIDHNDLSEFSRYFFPYVALVIEPRKRQSKTQIEKSEVSKFGTYLRYKRVSKYENKTRIEQRIIYFMRNYEYTDKSLANEISKQFNITNEKAITEIERVRNNYPNLKKSRKVLRKLENIPKYKPPGIGIDIQGKSRTKYKIRISGAREKEQLDRIINFMSVIIYLYIETYLYKKPKRQALKDKLKKLTHIAKRRNKVEPIVNHDEEVKSVKQITQMDKQRLAYKPEKGQNQWTRSCQNSGDDKKRRPKPYLSSKIGELLKKGYKFNNKTGFYERKVRIKGKSGTKQEVVLRTAKLDDIDETGQPTGKEIHYTCSPDENGEHMYVGFLSRSNNPFGHCMPCCFKKDPIISKNKEKKDYYLECIGKKATEKKEDETVKKELNMMGDKLYILQDTNKIQEGRLSDLPKYLNYLFNLGIGNTKVIKQHHLVETTTGFHFKYGSKQEDYPFLNAIGSCLDLTAGQLKNKMVVALEKDKSDMIFTSLNNGDIRNQFQTRGNFINFIKTGTQVNSLNFSLLNNMMSVPGVLTKNGVNIVVFKKTSRVIKRDFEKDRVKDDFILVCQNNEDINNITDPDKEAVILINENRNYYPIINIKKNNNNDKNIKITRTFRFEDSDKNIINILFDFYKRNCAGSFVEGISNRRKSPSAKNMYMTLKSVNVDQYLPKYQVLDTRNRCRYFLTNNMTIVPVNPSGSIYNLMIIKHLENMLISADKMIKQLEDLYEKSKYAIPIKPIGVYYEKGNSKDTIKVTAIMTEIYDIVPVSATNMSMAEINNKGFVMEDKPLYDKIDKEIMKGKDNYIMDNRITEVNKAKYMEESYHLFRLEFSAYVNENENFRKKIVKVIVDKKMDKDQKRNLIRRMLYKIVDSSLYDRYNALVQQGEQQDGQEGGKMDKFIHVISKQPNLNKYRIKNSRDLALTYKSREDCDKNPHCRWSHNQCYYALTRDMAIVFVNKVAEELLEADLKAKELLRVDEYFVSDIVDYEKFTERTGQRIIKSTNTTLKKMLTDIFGNENVPHIGKRRGVKDAEDDYEEMNTNNPLQDLHDFFIQRVMENNLSYFRTYANSYYWLKHPFYDTNSKNLGYYSTIQTSLANYFRSLVIDWLLDGKNKKEIDDKIKPILPNKMSMRDFVIKLSIDVTTFTDGEIIFYVLSKTQNIPINIYNDETKIIKVFSDGKINKTPSSVSKDGINIRLTYNTNSKSIPHDVESVYVK